MSNEIPASFLKRYLAGSLDCIIIFIVALIFRYLLNLLLPDNYSHFQIIQLTQFCTYAVVFAYFGYYHSQEGSSIGKKALKLKIIDRKSGGNPSFIKSGLRNTFGIMISAIPFFIGFIMIFFTRDRMALHDYIFSTQVVEDIVSPKSNFR